MGELSDKEKDALDFLLGFVSTEIFSLEQQETDKSRLNYSLCKDDAEKEIITIKKVEKFKKRISKCNPIIAGYLNVFTTHDPLNTEFEELREIIIKNFLLTEYYELFEKLVNSDLKELENYQFKSIIESLGFKYKPLKDFIQGVCDVNSYLIYKSFLDSYETNESKENSVEKNNETQLTNQERNIIKLNQYYNSIWHVRLFKENIIKRGDELYYHDRTMSFIENREKDLAENVILNIRSGWLTPFNRSLKRFMDQVVSCFKLVVEWKDNNTEIHENGIEIRLHLAMEFFRELPKSLRLNYDSNNDFLVFKMREYYINGFQMMLDFLKSDLMIDLEKSPFQPKMQKVIDDVKSAVDVESLKLSLNYQAANTINQKSNSDHIKSENKEIKTKNTNQPKLPLKVLDFNLENLFDLGLTPEILKSNFEQWLTDNKDILIDFKNQKIYAGVINAKKEMANMLEKIAISMQNNGMSQDQVEEFLISEKQKGNILLKEKCNQLPDELAYDFNLKLVLKTFERYEELKEKHFDSMMDEILKVDSSGFLVNNEKASSELQLENKQNHYQENTNPYPRIFKDYHSYSVFEKLVVEFGNKKENLSNYSYVYHKMTYEGLIHYDLLHKTYFEMLSDFDISIDRIKPKSEIGKIAFRDSIYAKAK